MMRLVLALLSCLIAAPASAQLGGGLMFPGPGTPHSSGASVVALDGHNFQHFTTLSGTQTLTTANAGDVIVVIGFANAGAASAGTVAVTDTFNGGGGLTWTQRYSALDATNQDWFFIFWAVAPSAITSGTVKVDFTSVSGYSNFTNFSVFGVSGAHTAAPFDANGPVYRPVASGLASMTTATGNDFVFGASYDTGTAGALGGGWSVLDNSLASNFFLSEDQVAVGTGTFTINIGGATLFAGSLIDAIIPGP